MAANKSDSYDDEQVSEAEREELAKEINALFILVSALNNSGINQLFESVAKTYLNKGTGLYNYVPIFWCRGPCTRWAQRFNGNKTDYYILLIIKLFYII